MQETDSGDENGGCGMTDAEMAERLLLGHRCSLCGREMAPEHEDTVCIRCANAAGVARAILDSKPWAREWMGGPKRRRRR